METFGVEINVSIKGRGYGGLKSPTGGSLEGYNREAVEHIHEELSLIQLAGPLEDRATRKISKLLWEY